MMVRRSPRRPRSLQGLVLLVAGVAFAMLWWMHSSPWVDLETGRVHMPVRVLPRARQDFVGAVRRLWGPRGCSLSLSESAGFFCEDDTDWLRRRDIFEAQQTRQRRSVSAANFARWWQFNYEPEFWCRFAERLGPVGSRGKWVCDPYRIAELSTERKKKCLVYSFGSYSDFSFEKSITERLPACEVHTFDPTIRPQSVSQKVHLHGWGLGAKVNETMRTLKNIMSTLNHTNYNVLEILRIDIKGQEWSVLIPQLEKKSLPFARQLLIELHPYRVSVVRRFFALLKHQGWVIIHKEPNVLEHGRTVEYVFLNVGWTLGAETPYTEPG